MKVLKFGKMPANTTRGFEFTLNDNQGKHNIQ